MKKLLLSQVKNVNGGAGVRKRHHLGQVEPVDVNKFIFKNIENNIRKNVENFLNRLTNLS